MKDEVIRDLTIQELYKDERTRDIVLPYLRVLMKYRLIESEADCLNFGHLGFSIGEIDFDMCANMGGGMPIEGWREMIEALRSFEYGEYNAK